MGTEVPTAVSSRLSPEEMQRIAAESMALLSAGDSLSDEQRRVVSATTEGRFLLRLADSGRFVDGL